ncbi:MAG: ankyrin repeat domain-containing protein [Aquificae bacterium]|nr:ankyrin repeat domain-containing protein [Aquificota bacterium]
MKRVFLLLFLIIPLVYSCQRIDASNPDDMLIVSAQLGDVERVKLALAKGADVNAQDDKGGTALHWAVFYGHGDIVRLLLMHGANPDIKDRNGITPVDVARINGRKEMLKILEEFRQKR